MYARDGNLIIRDKPRTLRHRWRAYFEILCSDEARGLDPSAQERCDLWAMTVGTVIWRCTVLPSDLPVVLQARDRAEANRITGALTITRYIP